MTAPFAMFFGIREWEMDQLTHDGFLAYEQAAKALIRKRQQQPAGGGRPRGRRSRRAG